MQRLGSEAESKIIPTAPHHDNKAKLMKVLTAMQEVGQYDPEAAGAMADNALAEYLLALGMEDIVMEWQAVPRRYA